MKNKILSQQTLILSLLENTNDGRTFVNTRQFRPSYLEIRIEVT